MNFYTFAIIITLIAGLGCSESDTSAPTPDIRELEEFSTPTKSDGFAVDVQRTASDSPVTAETTKQAVCQTILQSTEVSWGDGKRWGFEDRCESRHEFTYRGLYFSEEILTRSGAFLLGADVEIVSESGAERFEVRLVRVIDPDTFARSWAGLLTAHEVGGGASAEGLRPDISTIADVHEHYEGTVADNVISAHLQPVDVDEVPATATAALESESEVYTADYCSCELLVGSWYRALGSDGSVVGFINEAKVVYPEVPGDDETWTYFFQTSGELFDVMQ